MASAKQGNGGGPGKKPTANGMATAVAPAPVQNPSPHPDSNTQTHAVMPPGNAPVAAPTGRNRGVSPSVLPQNGAAAVGARSVGDAVGNLSHWLTESGTQHLGAAGSSVARRISELAKTTPGRLRLLSVLVGAVLAAVSVQALANMTTMTDKTKRIRTGSAPVVIASEQLRSSLAEADTAASTNFLSSAFLDRKQTRNYDDALARASASLEEISQRFGPSVEAHQLLVRVQANILRYATLIERARAESKFGDGAGAAKSLVAASTLLRDRIDTDLVVPIGETTATTSIMSLQVLTQKLIDHESSKAKRKVIIILSFLVGLFVLVAAQLYLYKKTRRLFNIPLLLASLFMVSSLIWVVKAGDAQRRDMRIASDEIRVRLDDVASLRSDVSSLERSNNRLLIDNRSIKGTEAEQIVIGSTGGDEQYPSDAFRKAGLGVRDGIGRAAMKELIVRWRRYDNALNQMRAAPEPRNLASAAGSAFTGFNVALDSLSSRDETLFISSYQNAQDRLNGLGSLVFFAPLLAAALAFVGLQRRINEYR